MHKWPARQSEKYKIPIKQHTRPATEAIMIMYIFPQCQYWIVEKDQAPNIRKPSIMFRGGGGYTKRKASQQQEHAAFDKSCAPASLSAENVEMTHQNRTLPQYLKPDERVLSARI